MSDSKTESGNSITDILYGKVNPAARTPFTWGPTRSSYGTDVLYTPNNGRAAPQINFEEGVFIDYRAFDRQNITPIYEFGYGLSYTNFSYSNLQINGSMAGPYTPTTGMTTSAPTFGNISNNIADYQYPAGFRILKEYIYPYLNSTNASKASDDPNRYGQTAAQFLPPNATSSGPQRLLPAGGAPGGNAELYDVLFTVRATITNTGGYNGEEVPQLYLAHGGPNDPPVVLRGFERVSIDRNMSTVVTFDLTRRDLSNWDTVRQNWVISSYPKTVYVGSSSRKLPLSMRLNVTM